MFVRRKIELVVVAITSIVTLSFGVVVSDASFAALPAREPSSSWPLLPRWLTLLMLVRCPE